VTEVNRIQASKILVFVTCILLATAYFVATEPLFAEHPDLDWIAYPQHISQDMDPLAVSGYTPSQIRTAYNLPSSGGAGTTIAIIDAYYTPSVLSDLSFFSSYFGLPAPTADNFEVHNMTTGIITAPSNWAMETCLDVEWAHAIAPDAKILLVEATNNGSALFSAVDWATDQLGVVAVSMSWGGDEISEEIYGDFRFNNPDIVFFAASGDSGSGVIYPSSSQYVVAVGGTTLHLYADGTVISEVGWSGSGGGISAYEPRPDYQTNYGLTAVNRSVPDVSYDADQATGFPVYCAGSWFKVGGTSAGAPQWAAIHALGLSANNSNFYLNAKTAYSSYFRDIISGNNGYPAGIGYDYVTGLGSPLTYNFTQQEPPPTPTPTPAPTDSPTPTPSPTPTYSPTPTPSPSPSPTPDPIPTPTPSPTPSPTPAPTDSETPSPPPTPTPSPTPDPTPTPTPTSTATEQPTPTASNTPDSPTPTTISPTPTATILTTPTVMPENPEVLLILLILLAVACVVALTRKHRTPP
jgi:hypothetical protein